MQNGRWTCQNVANTIQNGRWTCPHVGNPMQNGRWTCQNVANAIQNGRWTCPHVVNPMQNGRWTCPNVANAMQNDKFKFQTVANTRQMVPAKKSKKKFPNLLQKKNPKTISHPFSCPRGGMTKRCIHLIVCCESHKWICKKNNGTRWAHSSKTLCQSRGTH